MTGYSPHLLLLGMLLVLFVWERFYPHVVARLEDNLLILLMALLTLVSFGQVVARYLFNTGWSAALEFTMVLFSWLILVGMSYGIRRSTHLGVDIVLKLVPHSIAKDITVILTHTVNGGRTLTFVQSPVRHAPVARLQILGQHQQVLFVNDAVSKRCRADVAQWFIL